MTVPGTDEPVPYWGGPWDGRVSGKAAGRTETTHDGYTPSALTWRRRLPNHPDGEYVYAMVSRRWVWQARDMTGHEGPVTPAL